MQIKNNLLPMPEISMDDSMIASIIIMIDPRCGTEFAIDDMGDVGGGLRI